MVLLIGAIVLGNSLVYVLADLFGTVKPFLASSELELQMGYFTGLFIHKNYYHLLINLSMISTGVVILRKSVSISFLTLLIVACGTGAFVGYSYISEMIDYSGFAAGSSGISFGLLANSSLVYIKKFKWKRIALPSIVPFLFFLFEFVRFIGFKSEFFVSESPMSNVAHMSSILIGYFLITLYMISKIEYTDVLSHVEKEQFKYS